MTDREKKRLGQQLRVQADDLAAQSDKEVMLSMTATCNALLSGTSCADGVEQLDDGTFESLYAQFLRMSGEVERFFEAAGRRLGRQSQDAGVQRVRGELLAKRQMAQDLRDLISVKPAELEQLQRQIDADQAALQAAQAQVEEKEKTLEGLRALMETCSQERQDALKEQIDQLSDEYAEARIEYKRLERERQEQEGLVQGLNEQIGHIPQETKELLEEYDRKSAHLERLLQAEEKCAPEIQARMQEQIDALEPEVTKKQAQVEKLGALLESLTEQKTVHDEEQLTLSTQLLDWLERSMEQLREVAADHEGRLKNIKDSADRLERNLAACQQLRQGLENWLESDSTPLDAMIRALNTPEAVQLKQTLDPGKLERVEKLRWQIQDELRELDQILSVCTKAYRADMQAVRARGRA